MLITHSFSLASHSHLFVNLWLGCTVHRFHTLDGISGSDVEYSSCLSSPPSFGIRLVLVCVYISSLFPYLSASSLHVDAMIVFTDNFPPTCTVLPA